MRTPPNGFYDCRSPGSAISTPRTSRRRRWNKPGGFRPSSPNSKTGGMNCSSRGGTVSLIVFSRRHALPLPAGRFSRPRGSRATGAKRPADSHVQRPGQQPVRDRDQSAEQPRSRTIRAIEQVVSSQRQKPRPGPRAVRLRSSARQRHVRANAQARALAWQRSVHGPGRSVTALGQGACPVHEREQASSARSRQTCPVRHQPARGRI